MGWQPTRSRWTRGSRSRPSDRPGRPPLSFSTICGGTSPSHSHSYSHSYSRSSTSMSRSPPRRPRSWTIPREVEVPTSSIREAAIRCFSSLPRAGVGSPWKALRLHRRFRPLPHLRPSSIRRSRHRRHPWESEGRETTWWIARSGPPRGRPWAPRRA